MNLETFHFLRPLWLLAVPVAVLLWWLIRRARDPLRGWRAAMAPELMEALTLGRDRRDRWQGVVPLAAVILASVAVAGPAWRLEPSPFADDPAPVLVMMRADESMALEDIAPSRLERAQLKIADLAEVRKGKPLGLLAYAGSAHLVLPPTRDTGVVATMAANISPEIMPEKGDDLAGALKLAQRTLGETGGSIVLVADDARSLGSAELGINLPVHLLAIARDDTPELDALRSVASQLDASVTLMTPDGSDIDQLVRRTAKAPIMISAEDGGNRWAEDGWWLTPLIALLLLIRFRKERHLESVEAATAS